MVQVMGTHLLPTAGATAGAASVLVSMPLECIKTVIDTRGSPAEGLATVLQFWATGRSMVAANGTGALYRGLSPALVRRLGLGRPLISGTQRPCDLSSIAGCMHTAVRCLTGAPLRTACRWRRCHLRWCTGWRWKRVAVPWCHMPPST